MRLPSGLKRMQEMGPAASERLFTTRRASSIPINNHRPTKVAEIVCDGRVSVHPCSAHIRKVKLYKPSGK